MLVEIRKLVLTFLLCLVFGTICKTLGAPAPYMLGSLFGIWIFAGTLPSMQSHISIPRWFHITVILGLSTLIGATFTPEILSQIIKWSSTVVILILATLLAVVVAYTYLRKRGYDPALAIMCAIPGGQAEIAAISHTLVEKDYVVMFTHLVRVATVVCLIPALLAITQGSEGVQNSNIVTSQLPSVMNVGVITAFQFLLIALFGFILGKLFKLPIPHLLGPLIFSSALHVTGLITIPRTIEFVILAQITIGAGIGIRLAKVKINELFVYFFDAIVNTFILISIYCLVAMLAAYFLGFDTLTMVMAYIPGGVFEVTILAFIFGFDAAIIMFHHTIRLLLIFVSLPFVFSFLQTKKI